MKSKRSINKKFTSLTSNRFRLQAPHTSEVCLFGEFNLVATRRQQCSEDYTSPLFRSHSQYMVGLVFLGYTFTRLTLLSFGKAPSG